MENGWTTELKKLDEEKSLALHACGIKDKEIDRLRATNGEISALNMALMQTSGELCLVCGWRFIVPGVGCYKCQYTAKIAELIAYKQANHDPAESIRLNAEVMQLKQDNAALLATNQQLAADMGIAMQRAIDMTKIVKLIAEHPFAAEGRELARLIMKAEATK